MSLDSADLPTINPVWQDALSTIYQGDALLTLMGLPDNIATICITDPPYSSGGPSRFGKSSGQKYHSTNAIKRCPDFAGEYRDQRSFICWSSLWMNELRRIVIASGILGVFSDWRQLPATTDALQAGGWTWRGIVPWYKQIARPKQGRWTAACEYLVWGTNGDRALTGGCYPGFYSAVVDHNRKIHTTEKPLKLMYDLLAIAEEDSDKACLIDPFLGSASSMLAARRRNMRAIGIEIVPEICDMAVNRMLTDTDMLGDHHTTRETEQICLIS